jgi:Protein of unknown function (DUF3551)
MAQRPPTPHVPFAIRKNAEKQRQRENEMKTKQILKISAAPAAVFCALAFFTTATPASAATVDYCRTDVTSGMRGCGYTSLEQCRGMSSGRGGNCFENPFPEGGSSASNASRNAYAYQPKHHASTGARKPVENQ